MKVLILFTHPTLEKSVVNKVLSEDLESMEGVTFHDLYKAYPTFNIDVKREQYLVSTHDCIIYQHPFYWYSSPALLKEWQDLVLTKGWAYGINGNALEGKLFFNAITTGGLEQAYAKGSTSHFTMLELISPFKQMASLCKMVPLPPFVIHGTKSISNHLLQQYKKDYHRLIKEIVEDKLEVSKAVQQMYLND